MSILRDLRDGLLLRRMTTALESIAESQRTLAELASDSTHPQTPIRDIRPFVHDVLDPAAMNAAYKKQMIETRGMTEEEYEERYGGGRGGH